MISKFILQHTEMGWRWEIHTYGQNTGKLADALSTDEIPFKYSRPYDINYGPNILWGFSDPTIIVNKVLDIIRGGEHGKNHL